MKWLVLSALVLCGGCAGCFKKSDDAPVQKYVVTEDVFLMKVEADLHPARLALVPESSTTRGSGYNMSPQSILEYQAGRGETNDVVGVVTNGTEVAGLKTNTIRAFSIWYGGISKETAIYGKILNGPYAGKMVDVIDLVHWSKQRLKRKD